MLKMNILGYLDEETGDLFPDRKTYRAFVSGSAARELVEISGESPEGIENGEGCEVVVEERLFRDSYRYSVKPDRCEDSGVFLTLAAGDVEDTEELRSWLDEYAMQQY
ncbi:MAG: hypothetical protein ABEJ56_01950 [Candidatus Nanohaloarchaea archaeon]